MELIILILVISALSAAVARPATPAEKKRLKWFLVAVVLFIVICFLTNGFGGRIKEFSSNSSDQEIQQDHDDENNSSSKSQQPNTDEMMLYYHNHSNPLNLSEKDAKTLLQFSLNYPHPEDTFDKVIDYLSQYSFSNEATNKDDANRVAALAMAQGNIEVSHFFTDLANSIKTPKPGPPSLSEQAVQTRDLVNEAMNDEQNNDYWSAATCYDKIVDLIPDGHPDVSQKVFDVADALRNVAQKQTETNMQEALAAMKDLAPAMKGLFNIDNSQIVPIPPVARTSNQTPPAFDPSSLKKGDWITISTRSRLYFRDQFYRYAEKGEDFQVYEYRADKKRLYVLSHDQNGNVVALNLPDSENFP